MSEEQIRDALKEVIDSKIGVNMVSRAAICNGLARLS